jgi:hypothetical protein
MDIDTVVYWIKERHSIYLKKEAGEPRPWTEDPILRSYRFCNPYRENDKVTKWIAENWRNPNSDDPDLWYNMVIARLFNNPEMLAALGYSPTMQTVLSVAHERARQGLLVYNTAYLVSTNGVSMNKAQYLVERVLTPLWNVRGLVRPKEGDTLDAFAKRLLKFNGLAGFMTGQVIADTKYHGILAGASDWWSFALSGPGSRRGLNRIIGRDKDAPWKEHEWHRTALQVQQLVNSRITPLGLQPMHLQDIQNSFCEVDKYLRAKSGDGRPKQSYPG